MPIFSFLKLDHLKFRQQIVVIFCAGILLLAPLTSYIIYVTSNDVLIKQLHAQGVQIARTLAVQSKLALLYESTYTAQESVNFVSGFPDIEVLEIQLADGRNLYRSDSFDRRNIYIRPDNTTDLQSYEFDDEWVYVLSVMSEADADENLDITAIDGSTEQSLLGYVTVSMSKQTLLLLQRKSIQTNIFLSFLIAAIVSVILMRVSRRLTRPIEGLAQKMKLAEEGNTGVRAEVKGQPDVTVMQHAFNTMMDVLEKREKELELARDNAVENARMRGEFAANVTHELRTPMNAVLGMLDLLAESEISSRQIEYVDVARNSGETLLNLIDDILDFSKIDAGRVVSDTSDANLKELIEDVIRLLASQALAKNLDIGFFLEEDIPATIPLDRSRVQQVLINLIGNAIKFTDVGEVSLTVSHKSDDQGLILFEVADTGIGIGEADRGKIFEAFTQADASTTREYAGTGLGLTISKQIVELMGGDIGLESGLDSGSKFWFTLPCPREPAPVSLVKDETSADEVARVLLISSAHIIRRFSQQVFARKKLNWSVVDDYLEGAQALKHAYEHAEPFDYLIIDEDILFLKLTEFQSIFKNLIDTNTTSIVVLTNPFKPLRSADLKFSTIDKPLFSNSYNDLVAGKEQQRGKLTGSGRPGSLVGFDHTRILIVDDNRVNQQVAREMAQKLGCKADLAINGQRALEMVLKNKYDLILMDCNMPVMDGYDATNEIRQLEGTNKIPIIAMTANTTNAERQRCEQAGMNGFLAKPIRLGALEDELAHWLPESTLTLEDSPKNTDVTLPDTENYDTAFMEELFNSVGDVAYRMIEAFIEDTPVYIDSMKAALALGNAKQVRELAHTIKGSAANFGAHQLVGVAKTIEQLAQDSQLAQCELHTGTLINHFAALRHDLEQDVLKTTSNDTQEYQVAHRLLIADDDRTIRLALKDIFKGREFETIEATNGSQAVDICKRNVPDIILMDAVMPDTDGFTACKTIRDLPHCADIPILIITSLEDDEAIVKAFSSGATDYITKPLHFTVLKERVARLVQANKAGKKVKQMAYHDSLTGLPNRARLMQELRVILDRSKLDNKQIAVLFIDLDNFKNINDSLGHNVGDLLLKVVADRLRGCVRETDFIARLGGDEFTVVLEDIDSREILTKVAKTICESLNEPFVFLQKKMFVSASVGISVFPDDANDVNTLLKHADLAMFEAKKSKNHYVFYQSGMEDEISRRLQIEQELRQALDEDQLILHFQPQYDLTSDKVVAAEALVRWQHPKQGLLGPADFIPVAEQSGLITDLTRWVIIQAIKQITIWSKQGYSINLSINLSGKDMEITAQLVDYLSNLVEQYKLDTSLLELEITESILMGDPETSRQELLKLKTMGFTLAIDDFGTGYSSLNYLKNLPVDILKIDRVFVRDIEHSDNDRAIVKGIIALADSLQLKTIAEGVETEEQRDIISSLGCKVIQGYLISKPVPLEEFERSFKNNFTNIKKSPFIKAV